MEHGSLPGNAKFIHHSVSACPAGERCTVEISSGVAEYAAVGVDAIGTNREIVEDGLVAACIHLIHDSASAAASSMPADESGAVEVSSRVAEHAGVRRRASIGAAA